MTNAAPALDYLRLLSSVSLPASATKRSRQLDIIAETAKAMPEVAQLADLSTDLRLAHFIAQAAHESDGFATTEEYASGDAYEGRKDLGNIKPGDGMLYRGRGLIQLTGRANYRRFDEWCGGIGGHMYDVEPEAVAAFPGAALSAAWYWATHRLNAVADRDDLVAATRLINGGLNGLSSRATYLARAKAAIAAQRAGAVKPDYRRPTLHRGSQGEDVAVLQRALRADGQTIAIDGDYGPATELAVRAYQRSRGLVVDGIVAAATWQALAPLIDP